MYSGLCDLYSNYLPSQTFEGVNPLMYLQTARELLKRFNRAVNKKKPAVGLLSYCNNITEILNQKCLVTAENDWRNPTIQLNAFIHRSARLLSSTADRINKSIVAGDTYESAIENAKVDLVKVARSHCYLVILNNFQLSIIEQQSSNPALVPILQLLCDCFALTAIEKDLGEFTADGYCNYNQTQLLSSTIRLILKEIRPSAVILVDSFDFSDQYLNSAIGCYNGDVYENLFKWSNTGNPMNSSELAPGVSEILLPLMKANREKLNRKSKL